MHVQEEGNRTELSPLHESVKGAPAVIPAYALFVNATNALT